MRKPNAACTANYMAVMGQAFLTCLRVASRSTPLSLQAKLSTLTILRHWSTSMPSWLSRVLRVWPFGMTPAFPQKHRNLRSTEILF